MERPTPVSECVRVPVDDAVHFKVIQSLESFGVQEHAQIIKAVELMPDVEFDQVIFCIGNGEGRRRQFLSLFFRYFANSD